MPNFKEGISRNQYLMFPEIMDDYITPENPVRFIDAFVESLDLIDLEFTNAISKNRGTSAYNPKDLLKLYIYGYLNKIRSSRKLENETHRNVELMWLVKKLKPDFKTIADFRKDNLKGIQNVCKEFTLICKKLDLLGGDLIAVDGSKFKACNNKDKNYSEVSLNEQINSIDKKVEEYLKNLDEVDKEESGQKKLSLEELNDKLEKLKTIKLKMGKDKQISLVDRDSKLMKDKGSYIVAYNVQTAVDSKNHLIVASDVVQDGNDKNQLSSMVSKAQEILESDNLKVTADTGYYNETEILKVIEDGVTPYVFKPSGSPNDKKDLFTYNSFVYDNEKDIYVCPANQELVFKGFGKNKERLLRYYISKSCSGCNLKSKCTKDKVGRRIGRSINASALELMEERMRNNPEIGALRKQIVEHPFGTIKREFDQQYFLLKGLKKVKVEISLSILAYNLKRVINILGVKALMQNLTT